MPTAKSSDQELLDLYNEIDHWLRKIYGKDKFVDHGYLIQELTATNPVVARHQQVLRTAAQIRNSLIHNPLAPTVQPLLEPNPALVKAYREIRNALLSPLTALSIAVPASKIFTVDPRANLHTVLKSMEANTFTHVPIVEDNKMVGVLSENTLLSYLTKTGEAIITRDMTIADFSEFTPLSAHKSEQFVFLPRQASLNQVYEVFNKAIRAHERIGMLFITEHGKAEEKPLGIITAWDLASPEFGL
jgi:predicted transcriptional regulator